MGCFRLTPSELSAKGHHWLATPDHVELQILAEGGPVAVVLWRHCLRQGPRFQLYVDHCARSLGVSRPAVTRAFQALSRCRVAWHTPGARGADGRLSGSHWNVSSLPREELEAAPAGASPTPPQNRGSVDFTLTKNKDKDEHRSKTVCVNACAHETFAQLWEKYPNKAAEAEALQAWLGFIKSNRLNSDQIDQLLSYILANLARRLESGEWIEGSRYIPQLKNYLGGRRWRDPPKQQLDAVRAAGLKPVKPRKTADVSLKEQLTDRSWADQGAQEARDEYEEGPSPANRSNSLSAPPRASHDEGSEHELERPRNPLKNCTIENQTAADPRRDADAIGPRCGGVPAGRAENHDVTGGWR